MKLLGAVLILLFVSPAVNAQTKKQWKEYSFAKDEFAISAPDAPDTYPDPQNSEVRIYSFRPDPSSRIAIRVADWKIDCDAKRKQLKENAPATISVRDMFLGKHMGIESTELRSKTPGWTTSERFFCLPDKVIVLSIGYPSKSNSQAVKRMLDSFRLIEN